MARPQEIRKHVPQRTCIACRQKKPKRELVRIVRTPDGAVEVDPRGKRAGRGAYICRLQGCWATGLEKNKLEHVLKTDIVHEQRAALVAYSMTLPGGDAHVGSREDHGQEGVPG